MLSIECPKPAYDKLVRNGLERRITGSEGVKDILLTPYIEGELTYSIFDLSKSQLVSSFNGISERRRLYKDLFDTQCDLERYDGVIDKIDFLICHPSLLAFAALGEDVLNYQKYGFLSRRKLEEAVTSLSLGERHEVFGEKDNYVWRNGKFKNELSNGYHGDLTIRQTNISGNHFNVNTLFGDEEDFDTYKNVDGQRKGIHAIDVSWSSFLMGILRYAYAIDKAKTFHISNWTKVLDEVGYVPTFTAEYEFGAGGNQIVLDGLKDSELLISGEKIEGKFYWSLSLACSGERIYDACFHDGKLVYIREDGNGEIGFSDTDKRFSPQVVYDENDLQDLLRGTYRLFARDRRILPEIMGMFLSQTES